MRHFLHCIEIGIVCRNLNTAFPTAGTIVVLGSRIIEHATVDSEVVVMETFVHGAVCRTYPYAFFILAENCTSTTAQTETDDDRFGIRSNHAETGIAL